MKLNTQNLKSLGYKVVVSELLIVYLHGQLQYTKYHISSYLGFTFPPSASRIVPGIVKSVLLPVNMVILDSVHHRELIGLSY